jgi:hypothetical protein
VSIGLTRPEVLGVLRERSIDCKEIELKIKGEEKREDTRDRKEERASSKPK